MWINKHIKQYKVDMVRQYSSASDETDLCDFTIEL